MVSIVTIYAHIERTKDSLRQGAFTSEASVSQGIILPTLHALGWPVFDTKIVTPEFSLEGRRVDFALCHPSNRASVFIEVKKVGFSDGADRQLFEYAFHLGVPMAILTDGQEWSFYLPGEQGHYDERRVYKLDLLERNVEEVVERLTKYLGYERVCNGEALKAARSDHQDVARGRDIESYLPVAWHSLIDEQDSLLLELLAEKVEDLCGYKPDFDLCSRFLEQRTRQESTSVDHASKKQSQTQAAPRLREKKENSPVEPSDRFSFAANGSQYEARSARDVMIKVFQLLAQQDSEFLEKYSARKHGKKRRYLARNREDLYPGRPDLASSHSTQIVAGWWMGTNYSRRDIQKILDLALEVVQPRLRSTIRVNVV